MYPPLSTKCTMTCGRHKFYTDILAWVRLKLHHSRETMSELTCTLKKACPHTQNSRQNGDLCASILHFVKKLVCLVFRLHILSDAWLHYWPFVPCESQKQHQKAPMYLTEHTQTSTKHWARKVQGPLVPWLYRIFSKKRHNIECHEIKIISKIYFTMLNFAHYLMSAIQF